MPSVVNFATMYRVCSRYTNAACVSGDSGNS